MMLRLNVIALTIALSLTAATSNLITHERWQSGHSQTRKASAAAADELPTQNRSATRAGRRKPLRNLKGSSDGGFLRPNADCNGIAADDAQSGKGKGGKGGGFGGDNISADGVGGGKGKGGGYGGDNISADGVGGGKGKGGGYGGDNISADGVGGGNGKKGRSSRGVGADTVNEDFLNFGGSGQGKSGSSSSRGVGADNVNTDMANNNDVQSDMANGGSSDDSSSKGEGKRGLRQATNRVLNWWNPFKGVGNKGDYYDPDAAYSEDYPPDSFSEDVVPDTYSEDGDFTGDSSTPVPTEFPSPSPSMRPTDQPTPLPTTSAPTNAPSPGPTQAPSPLPTTSAPTAKPSPGPTQAPNPLPTTSAPTAKPSPGPTQAPNPLPTTDAPKPSPTDDPTESDDAFMADFTREPSPLPTFAPKVWTTRTPATMPTSGPTPIPTAIRSKSPSRRPVAPPTVTTDQLPPVRDSKSESESKFGGEFDEVTEDNEDTFTGEDIVFSTASSKSSKGEYGGDFVVDCVEEDTVTPPPPPTGIGTDAVPPPSKTKSSKTAPPPTGIGTDAVTPPAEGEKKSKKTQPPSSPKIEPDTNPPPVVAPTEAPVKEPPRCDAPGYPACCTLPGYPDCPATKSPTSKPSSSPTASPSTAPSPLPSSRPSATPSLVPSAVPTIKPSGSPSSNPSAVPTIKPSGSPSSNPSALPSSAPSGGPSTPPSSVPTIGPSAGPSSVPSASPSSKPSASPSSTPTSEPTLAPVEFMTRVPTAPVTPPIGIDSLPPPVVEPPRCDYPGFPDCCTLPEYPDCPTEATLEPTAPPTAIPSPSPTTQPTSVPTKSPSSAPTKFPSSAPTMFPSTAPTKAPEMAPVAPPAALPVATPVAVPTNIPSSAPTKSPSSAPTKAPEMAPVAPPVALPVATPVAAPVGCPEAFVYCPNRSTCFQDMVFNDGTLPPGENAWGFNIHYNHLEDGIIDDCEIWMGVTGCDLSTGTQVGTATITAELFHFCLDLNDYESNSFQLYTGKCEASDGGAHVVNGGVCIEAGIAEYARFYNEYTLVYEGTEMHQTFTFDRSNEVHWTGYTAFPIGDTDREYLVGHLEVCPIFEQEGTSLPTEYPSASPTNTPTSLPTSLPTGVPTSVPTKVPVVTPVATPVSSPEGCAEAYVYCPGRSTCFLDAAFNNGTLIAGENAWGWNIHYNAAEDGTVDDCEIWMGVTGCDQSTGTQVGTVTITAELFHYCLDLHEYESNAFQLYTGTCEASDGGAHLVNGGICASEQIAEFARFVNNYTLVYEGTEMHQTFTFDRADAVNWDGYTAFPIGGAGREYLVGHVQACPVGDFVEQGTALPTRSPTALPTSSPTKSPSPPPTKLPTNWPSMSPTEAPTKSPSDSPTKKPTNAPTNAPTLSPTAQPTKLPSSPPTISPSEVPTDSPTKKPTAAPITDSPTKKPTAAPITDSPTSAPTDMPSKAPTKSPTASPITQQPTESPTDMPFISCTQLDTCNTGFVYCPGRSTCFSDDAIGWSIEYNITDHIIDDCEIYIDIGPGCDLTSATRVGTFTIAPTLVHYCLNLGDYESNAFHFYAGTCEANDGGRHLYMGDVCTEANMEMYAECWETYPLIDEGGPFTDVFTFQEGDIATGDWTSNYEVFPIGTEFRMYMTAHVDVCETPNIEPDAAIPTKQPTAAPTDAPTRAPTDMPNKAPTKSPTAAPSDAPTRAPTDMPNKAPTKSPTAAPSDAPTRDPTDSPTAAPVTPSPTASPTAAPVTPSPTASPSGPPTKEPTAEPSPQPSSEPTECVCEASAVYDEESGAVTIKFDMCDQEPLSSDFIGIYPCDATTNVTDQKWWDETVCKQFPAACGGFQFGYEEGQTYVAEDYIWFSYTCGSPQDGGCQTVAGYEWPSSGTVTIDPTMPNATWAYGKQGRTLEPGCYKVLLNREMYFISPPPYPTICGPWEDALSFTVPS